MERDPAFARARRSAAASALLPAGFALVIGVAALAMFAWTRSTHDDWIETTGTVQEVVSDLDAVVAVRLADGSEVTVTVEAGRVQPGESIELWYPPGAPEDAEVLAPGGFLVAIAVLLTAFALVTIGMGVARASRTSRLERLLTAPHAPEVCVVDVTSGLGGRGGPARAAHVLRRGDLPPTAERVVEARPDLVVAVDVDGLDGVEGVFGGQLLRWPGRREVVILAADGTFALGGRELRKVAAALRRSRVRRQFVAPISPVTTTPATPVSPLVRTRLAATRVLTTAALGAVALGAVSATVAGLARGDAPLATLAALAVVAWLVNRVSTRRMLRRPPRWAPQPPAGGPGAPVLVAPPTPLADGGPTAEPLITQAVRVLGAPVAPSRSAIVAMAVVVCAAGVLVGRA